MPLRARGSVCRAHGPHSGEGWPASGVNVSDLPTHDPMPVLRYLTSRDWIGVAKAGDRAWLLSEARKLIG